MAFVRNQAVPTADEIKNNMSLSSEMIKLKKQRDCDLRSIVTRTSDKFLVIIGPCSADNEFAVLKYLGLLAKIISDNKQIRDRLLIVPRIYTNKPRTAGKGYKGMLHNPDPAGFPDIVTGIQAIRRMHIRAISETGLTGADEMLYPSNLVYVDDLLSYISVGTHSVENQQHRLTCSGVNVPVGMNNPPSGDFNVMYNSIVASQGSHTFMFQDYEVSTSGNPLTHAILRGSINRYGECIPNYHYEDLQRAIEMYKVRSDKIENPMIVVDVNHCNSGKKYYEQPRIARYILHCRKHNPEMRHMVRGLMIESYIVEGRQDINGALEGQSITDSCLGWSATEELLNYIAENV